MKGSTFEQDIVQENIEADIVQMGDEIKLPLLSKNEPVSATLHVNEGLVDKRLSSLDVFRGLTVAAMILVDYAGGLWWGINHAPWNGVTFADFVVPAFLFIVGVSIALAYEIRCCLQRISIAYGVVACFELLAKRKKLEANGTFCGIIRVYCWQWAGGAVLACLYLGLLYGLYVPTWQFEAPEPMDVNVLTKNISLLQVECNVRGSLSPGCNAVSFIDRSIMGISHLHRKPPYQRMQACSVDSPYAGPLPENAPAWCLAPFDPEGLLSSSPAVITCFIGAHYGHVLLFEKGHRRRIWQWSTTGAALVISGLGLDIAGIPINKQLYTLSYTFLTAGASGLAFTVIYVIVDVYRWRLSTIVFKWIGAHALMIYALFSCSVIPLAIQGLYWRSPENNMISIILEALGLA